LAAPPLPWTSASPLARSPGSPPLEIDALEARLTLTAQARRAQRSFAERERGLDTCSSGVARTNSGDASA